MALIALRILFLYVALIFQSHKNKNQSLIYYFMPRKFRRHPGKDNIWGQRFKQLVVPGGSPNRFASTQCAI